MKIGLGGCFREGQGFETLVKEFIYLMHTFLEKVPLKVDLLYVVMIPVILSNLTHHFLILNYFKIFLYFEKILGLLLL